MTGLTFEQAEAEVSALCERHLASFRAWGTAFAVETNAFCARLAESNLSPAAQMAIANVIDKAMVDIDKIDFEALAAQADQDADPS